MPEPTYTDFLDAWETYLQPSPPLSDQLADLLLYVERQQNRPLPLAARLAVYARQVAVRLAPPHSRPTSLTPGDNSRPSFWECLKWTGYIGGLILALPFALAWFLVLLLMASLTALHLRLFGPLLVALKRTPQEKAQDSQAAALLPYSILNWRI